MNTQGPTEIFAERLAVQTRQHSATDPHLIACHFTAGWLAAVDALNARNLLQDLAPAAPTPQPDADGWITHNPGDPMPCAGDLLVEVRCLDGGERDWIEKAEWYSTDVGRSNWWTGKGMACTGTQIIAWRPYQP